MASASLDGFLPLRLDEEAHVQGGYSKVHKLLVNGPAVLASLVDMRSFVGFKFMLQCQGTAGEKTPKRDP